MLTTRPDRQSHSQEGRNSKIPDQTGSLTTKKAAIQKYLDFLGFELMTMICAAQHANH